MNVFIDGQYAFSLQRVLAAELRTGQDLSEVEIRDLKRRDREEGAYERALTYLSYRPRSEWEIRTRLIDKGVTEEIIPEIMSRLRHSGLANDLEFARYWVDNRRAFRPRGPWGLRAELRQKRISEEVIRVVVDGLDEQSDAMNAAKRAARRLAHFDEHLFRRRLLGFLQRRGFNHDVCKRVVDELWAQVAAQRQADPDSRGPDHA